MRLDNELATMLREQLLKAFQYFPPGRTAAWEPELQVVLELLLFALSIWRSSATPGAQLMNLRYLDVRAAKRDSLTDGKLRSPGIAQAPPALTGVEGPGPSGAQRLLLVAGSVLAPYAFGRAARWADRGEWHDGGPANGWARRVRAALRSARAAHRVAALLNMCAFLYDGKYRTLLERVLGARLVLRQASMARVVSFEYLNRQLVWHEVSELLLFLLPLVDVRRLRAWAVSVLPRMPGTTAAAAAATAKAADGAMHGTGGAGGGALSRRSVNPCPVCGSTDILVPLRALPCGHVFCYFCAVQRTRADPHFACPLDGQRIAALRRWGPHEGTNEGGGVIA